MNDGWTLEGHAENFSQQQGQKELSQESNKQRWTREKNQCVQFEVPESSGLHDSGTLEEVKLKNKPTDPEPRSSNILPAHVLPVTCWFKEAWFKVNKNSV